MKQSCKLFFFGDSISFGQGVSPHATWVTRLSAELDGAFPDADIVVQNPSINGNTTRMALERIGFDVQSHRPDVVFVEFGLNDCNIWQTDNGLPRTSRESFATNLAEIVDRLRASGARVVALGTNHPTTRTEGVMAGSEINYEAHNAMYADIVRTTARAKDAVLVDIRKHIQDTVPMAELGSLLLEDRLHLSRKGHDVYFAFYRDPVLSAVCSVLQAGH